MAEQKKANTCLDLGVKGAGITVALCMCMEATLAINASLVRYSARLPITQTTASSLALQDALEQEISDSRPELIARLSWPDSFTISLLSIDGVETRCETSCYNQFCKRVDFVDGEIA